MQDAHCLNNKFTLNKVSGTVLKVHKNDNCLAPILKFELFHC
jgi:hypothetical protein